MKNNHKRTKEELIQEDKYQLIKTIKVMKAKYNFNNIPISDSILSLAASNPNFTLSEIY